MPHLSLAVLRAHQHILLHQASVAVISFPTAHLQILQMFLLALTVLRILIQFIFVYIAFAWHVQRHRHCVRLINANLRVLFLMQYALLWYMHSVFFLGEGVPRVRIDVVRGGTLVYQQRLILLLPLMLLLQIHILFIVRHFKMHFSFFYWLD